MIEQQSAEWHQLRCGLVTASRIKDLLSNGRGGKPSLTRATYQREILAEMLTGETKQFGGSRATDWGNELEAEAVREYEIQTGEICEVIDFVKHPTLKAGASPDRLIGSNGGAEIKCPFNSEVHLNTLINGMPAEHMSQVQFNLLCTGRDWWEFISFDPRFPPDLRLYVERVYPDQEWFKSTEKAIRIFFAEIEIMKNKLTKRECAA